MTHVPPVIDAPHLAAAYRAALLGDCVPFWFPRCVDRMHGGFLHCLDRDGSIVDTDKSVWAQARMTWMLLTLYDKVDRRPAWLAWAEGGLRFIERHCIDTDGRLFFHVTADGRPIRQRRYAYSEAFAAIAYAAHAHVTESDASASRARTMFDLFTYWNFTPGVMPAKFTAERPAIGLAPRMITLVTAQELRASLGDDAVFRRWIDRAIEEIAGFFVKANEQCVMETVAPDGAIIDHFDGRLLNPGHAIEAAWFILREGAWRADDGLIRLGCRMLDWMLERGWDSEFGGLFCLRDVYGKAIQEYWHDMKFWWPHNEALIATLLAWRLTGDSRYALWHRKLFDWSFGRFGDPLHGEWYGYLHRDGRPATTLKGGLWKSFFHHPRCLLLCWTLCEPACKQSHLTINSP